MKVTFTLAIMLFFVTTITDIRAQPVPQKMNLKKQNSVTKRTEKMKEVLKQEFWNSPQRPDYPIQDYYHLPFTKAENQFQTAGSDSTPPTDPVNLVVVQESIHSIFATWTASSDLESGIDYYAYGIGTEPGEADMRWWQSVGLNTKTNSASLAELGIPAGSTFYITVHAVNGAGLQSNSIASPPISAGWEDLGNPENELAIAFADFGYDSTGVNLIAGWDSAEIEIIENFVSRMNPIIKAIYGPPSHSYTVTLVKNLWYSGSNIFFPSSNEVHMSDFYPQLLTHELLHAYRDNVILSTDDLWRFHPKLSGFEESFAQGVSYICMNRYIELYPDGAIVDSTYLFGSSMDWDYDFRNVPALTSEDFWSDYGGMGLFWERYELGAATMRKIHLEDTDFFRNFNAEYYSRLNADHNLVTSRDLMIDIISMVVPEIEMKPAVEWLQMQRIFDCQISPGRKIWVRTQHYPWNEFIIFQRVHYYETFVNGSDWTYWDDTAGEWGFHNLNGATGTGTVSTYSDSVTWNGELLIEPIDNPPVFFGFGSDVINFSTDNDLQPWPGGDPEEYVLQMLNLNLYRFNLTFDNTETEVFRVMGNELRNTTGVFGGIKHATNGVIYLDHENFAEEPALQVNMGAFWGERQWASVTNAKTGGTDSQPGKIQVRFVQDDGVQYFAQRNIDWGSWNGNQAFLFDTEEMIVDSSGVITGIEKHGIDEFVVHQNYPNPFNPATEIRYRLPQAENVEISIFNILGQRIKSLLNKREESGSHKILWDGSNDAGLPVGSGFYFYLVKAGENRVIKKMLLLR